MFDPKTRILIVDDMPSMRKFIAISCKGLGFSDFIEGKNGNDGYEKLVSSNPPVGVVLCDWNMPECTGAEFLKRVRSEPRFKLLPFIMITAEGEKEFVVNAKELGVSAYIVKPFTADQLKEKLESVQAHLKAA